MHLPASLPEPGGSAAAHRRVHRALQHRMGPRQLRYRVAFFITGLVTLALVVTLPFSVKSVVDDILGSSVGRVFSITPQGGESATLTVSEHLRHREANYTK